jgi:hypothetical protein
MLNKELLDELFRAFVHQKSNPSAELFRGLAGVTGQSVANLKAQYVRCYQKAMSKNVDPFDAPIPTR